MAVPANRLTMLEPVFEYVDVGVGSDTVVYRELLRGFHVGASGDVTFVDPSGNSHTVTCTGGMYYPYACKQIMATATTATGILGFKFNTKPL